MKINLNLLPKVFDEDIIIPEDFYKGTSIKDLSKVKVVGSIKYNVIDEVVIDLDVSGEMLLIDAITNEPIKYPFSIKILENLAEIDENDAKYLEKISHEQEPWILSRRGLDPDERSDKTISKESIANYFINEIFQPEMEAWD